MGLSLSAEDLCGEDQQVHIVAEEDGGELVGCVLVAFLGEETRIRQVAVDEQWRGRGVGSELVQRAEKAARDRQRFRVVLHARVVAFRFFERLGYTAVSDVFTEVTISHIKMQKQLEDR
jgi:predicted GNAT family N-acyltransferase